MIVALDAQLAVGTATGIGVYARDLIRALGTRGVALRALRAPWLDPWRFDRRVLWDQVLFPLAVARSDATLVHATSGTLPLIRRLPTVVTVHDMAWLRVQGHTRAYARAYFGGLMRRLYRGADAVIVDSAFARDEYRVLSGDAREPHVIHPGVDERYAAIERRPDTQPFALVVGTIEARKNLLRVIEAIAHVPQVRVVVVGPPTPYIHTVRRRIAELDLAERVDLRGYVDAAVLDDLYARATLAVVPSRYEGFGYAVAEARCAGLPFVAARGSSLTEIAGSDATLVDPDDTGAWVEALRAVLADRDGAERRAAAARAHAVAQFAWTTAAAALEAVYRRVGGATDAGQ